jgi:hypothetical protein
LLSTKAHQFKRRPRIPFFDDLSGEMQSLLLDLVLFSLGHFGFYPNSTETQILIAAIAIKTANARLSPKTGTLRLTRLPTRAAGTTVSKIGTAISHSI